MADVGKVIICTIFSVNWMAHVKTLRPANDAQRYRWESWAAPKGKDGKIDHNTALTGDDLIAFVNAKLFPYLHGFKAKATGPNTIDTKSAKSSAR